MFHEALTGVAHAIHDVAFATCQLSTELPPTATLVGLAMSVTVGAGFAGFVTRTAADAETPSQVIVNVVDCVSPLIVCVLPSAFFEPVHAAFAGEADAVHAAGFPDVAQVSDVESGEIPSDGFAVSVTPTGAGAASVVTSTERVTLPSEFEQVMV